MPLALERYVQTDEVQVIEALRSGDAGGLETLVRLHQHRAMGVAVNLCGDHNLAEDVVADSFLLAFRNVHRYDPSRPFAPWFYRIVLNETRAALRRRRSAERVRATGGIDEAAGDRQRTPEATAVANELAAELLREVDRLPHKQREAIVLRYYMDMDEQSVATTLGIPLGTAKWRLYAARKRLLRQLTTREEETIHPLQKGRTL